MNQRSVVNGHFTVAVCVGGREAVAFERDTFRKMQLNKCHVGNIYLTVAVRVTKQDIIFTYCFRKYVGVVLASIVGIDCQRFSIAKRDGIGVSGFERDAVPAEIKAPDLGVFVHKT